MFIILMLGLLGATEIEGRTTIAAEEFSAMLRGLQPGLEDVEFVYEGQILHTGGQKWNGNGPDPFEKTFQGIFAFRHDMFIHDEIYIELSDKTRPLVRNTSCLRATRQYKKTHTPDRGQPAGRGYAEQAGDIGTMEAPMSPLSFFFLPKLAFSDYYRDPSFSISHVGWEEVSGRRCMKVEVTSGWVTERYWLDLERGGNALRYEFKVQSNLRMRTVDIGLRRFQSETGDSYWLPASAKRQTFMSRAGVTKEPVLEETYEVVGGSVRINQRSPDGRFTIDWKTRPVTEQIKSLVYRVDHAMPPRSDPVGVKKRLDDLISVADLQARELEASAPSRDSWIPQYGTSLCFMLIGLLVLALAGWLKRRS